MDAYSKLFFWNLEFIFWILVVIHSGWFNRRGNGHSFGCYFWNLLFNHRFEKMKLIFIILFSIALSSCYKTLELDNFSKEEWKSFKLKCTDYRLSKIDLLLENQDLLLESTQNEIESLLGAAEEHELYERNQKFFHYRLSPNDSCKNEQYSIKYLSIRFNAIGRASDVQLIIRE